MKKEKGAYGFDAAKEEYGDLIKAGIIDPTKVARLALQNASSVASLMITTQAMVAENPEKKAPMLPPLGYSPSQPEDESRPIPSFHTERQYHEWPETDLPMMPWEKSWR